MSTPYLASSLATRAVRRSGLFVEARSRRVRTFHDPSVRETLVFDLIFLLVFRPLWWDPASRGMLARGGLRQAMFGAPFLARSPCYGGKQCIPEEGCFVAQGAAESQRCLGRWERTLWPEPPACRFVTTTPSVSSPVASPLVRRRRA